MAHFAQLDENNVVLRVVAVDSSIVPDENGAEFCRSIFREGNWIQTSYNGRIRKNFAGVGHIYDPVRDAFMEPQPEGYGWVLDEATCRWTNPWREEHQRLATMEITRV